MSEEELNKNTVAQLKEMCDAKGIEVPEGARKADIITLLLEAEKKAAPKEAAKAAPKAEPKPAPKVEPKKEPEKKVEPKKAEPAKKTETAQKPTQKGPGIEVKMAKIGYVDMYDYMTLGVGVWGLIWSVIYFILFLLTQVGWIWVAGFGTPMSYYALASLGLFIIQIYIYAVLALFPFVIKKIGLPLVKKSKTFPLHFIKTGEDFRSFIIFIGFWSCLFFWIGGWEVKWPHFLSVVLLAIIMLADPLSAKWKKIPAKKVKQY